MSSRHRLVRVVLQGISIGHHSFQCEPTSSNKCSSHHTRLDRYHRHIHLGQRYCPHLLYRALHHTIRIHTAVRAAASAGALCQCSHDACWGCADHSGGRKSRDDESRIQRSIHLHQGHQRGRQVLVPRALRPFGRRVHLLQHQRRCLRIFQRLRRGGHPRGLWVDHFRANRLILSWHRTMQRTRYLHRQNLPMRV